MLQPVQKQFKSAERQTRIDKAVSIPTKAATKTGITSSEGNNEEQEEEVEKIKTTFEAFIIDKIIKLRIQAGSYGNIELLPE